MKEAIVFDSWALIAFFDDEPPAEKIEQIISDAINRNQQLLISVINLGEIWYSYSRAQSETLADEVILHIRSLNFKIVQADWELTKIAARFKVAGGMSYADCFAAALAKQNGSKLVTGDREFERVENEIEIVWV